MAGAPAARCASTPAFLPSCPPPLLQPAGSERPCRFRHRRPGRAIGRGTITGSGDGICAVRIGGECGAAGLEELHQQGLFIRRGRPHQALFDDLPIKFDPQSRSGGQSPCAVFEIKFRPGEPGAQDRGK